MTLRAFTCKRHHGFVLGPLSRVSPALPKTRDTILTDRYYLEMIYIVLLCTLSHHPQNNSNSNHRIPFEIFLVCKDVDRAQFFVTMFDHTRLSHLKRMADKAHRQKENCNHCQNPFHVRVYCQSDMYLHYTTNMILKNNSLN